MLEPMAGVVALVIGALMAPSAAASPVLVLTTKPPSAKGHGHAIKPGTKVDGFVRFGPCGEIELKGRLETNRSPTDSIGVRKAFNNGCREPPGTPFFFASIKTVKLTSGGEFALTSVRVDEYSGPEASTRHCVWGITELIGTFSIPSQTVETHNMSGAGTLDTQHSDPGCPTHEEFKGLAASVVKNHQNIAAEAA